MDGTSRYFFCIVPRALVAESYTLKPFSYTSWFKQSFKKAAKDHLTRCRIQAMIWSLHLNITRIPHERVVLRCRNIFADASLRPITKIELITSVDSQSWRLAMDRNMFPSLYFVTSHDPLSSSQPTRFGPVGFPGEVHDLGHWPSVLLSNRVGKRKGWLSNPKRVGLERVSRAPSSIHSRQGTRRQTAGRSDRKRQEHDAGTAQEEIASSVGQHHVGDRSLLFFFGREGWRADRRSTDRPSVLYRSCSLAVVARRNTCARTACDENLNVVVSS